MKKKRKITKIAHLILAVILLGGFCGSGAGATANKNETGRRLQKLDKYIEMGLSNNLALKQQRFSLDKSLQALREARGMFLPLISIEARYSRAGGGRVIDIPIGDMVNPIYQTLNQLLTLHGIPGNFPTNIPNEQVPFLRETEHDTKLRVIQPLFQPAIYYNLKIKKDLTGIEKAKLNVFKRQLVADIKNAYYTYLKTVKVMQLLDNTKELLEENVRLSKSLFKNHKVTEEVVFRSEAELSKLEQQRAEAEKSVRLAASYFNFLLNRSLDAEIVVDSLDQKPVFRAYDLETLTARALKRRSEFQQLQGAIDAARHTIGLHRSSILPTVTAVFDYGFQGETYSFTGEDDYWMGSLVLSWNLFCGGQDLAKKKQAVIQKKQLEAQHAELETKIKLQVKEAYHNMNVAKKAVTSSEDTLNSRKQAFFIVSKKYKQGMVPQIEYTKARNDYTNAGISHIIAIAGAKKKSSPKKTSFQ
ncbi:MAG: TolC family protein [Candidatus Aminicenantes bacterium]|nr:TolC family protein [Candidatus Aminicenantes bacterium]NIM80390.1 TolC family protein [Candidatus Aminicenantes bacterium]NIN19777.1 TolC family protein [Candidatus Aminicenantes bacterium]NIN43659.1 TolC family protein [Candidatus Aminicenantes bacterium]NIN86404.1 TolC family protein [Candidatus Aminicenantes bacterium]